MRDVSKKRGLDQNTKELAVYLLSVLLGVLVLAAVVTEKPGYILALMVISLVWLGWYNPAVGGETQESRLGARGGNDCGRAGLAVPLYQARGSDFCALPKVPV